MNKLEINTIDNRTVIKIDNEVEVFIYGDFEIKKKERAITGSKDMEIKIDSESVGKQIAPSIVKY